MKLPLRYNEWLIRNIITGVTSIGTKSNENTIYGHVTHNTIYGHHVTQDSYCSYGWSEISTSQQQLVSDGAGSTNLGGTLNSNHPSRQQPPLSSGSLSLSPSLSISLSLSLFLSFSLYLSHYHDYGNTIYGRVTHNTIYGHHVTQFCKSI
eukprot:sb/3473555/